MMLRLSVGLALLAFAAGCDDTKPTFPPLPGTLVGESAHFRLFATPDFDMSSFPADLHGSAGLDAPETDWADQRTMLKMPEGARKINYHLLTNG